MWRIFTLTRPHAPGVLWLPMTLVAELKSKSVTAKMLGISKESLDRLRKSGKILAVRIGGRILFADAEIQQFIQRSIERRKDVA
jgi:excisionase family DNA binding protein